MRTLQDKCYLLFTAFKTGKLGQTVMPEDSSPKFGITAKDLESRIAYFTLPMALNYQRDSYKLWEAALKTWNDPETRFVFDVNEITKKSEDDVRQALMKYKVALQPNKHVSTWRTIAKTVSGNWGSFTTFFDATRVPMGKVGKARDGAAPADLLQLKKLVNIDHKKGFPYLSGPKIFNYWSFIVSTYGGVKLSNRDQIDIAPDTHITQCSVKLGVITEEEVNALGPARAKETISARWRELLKGSGIDPIDMHPPLWFWSRNGWLFDLPKE